MKKIQKLFLNFDNEQLEKQYLHDKSIEIQRPVYLLLLLSSLISNGVVLMFHFFVHHISTWFLNVGCLIFIILQVIVIFILKKQQFQQIALTMSNITLGFLQLDIDANISTQNEYYAYGCIFTYLQCAIFFVSNFNHTLVQIFSLFVIRGSITTILSKRPDYLIFFVGFFGSLMILITIYVKDRNSRRYFIQNLKEHHLDEISQFLINKPYFRIQYNEAQLSFNLLSHSNLDKFPGFDLSQCNSCNARQFLRNYRLDSGKNLETMIIKRQINYSKGIILTVKLGKLKLTLRICELDPQFYQYIVIFEDLKRSRENSYLINQQQVKLKEFLHSNNKFLHQKIFNLGAYSVLLLHNKIIKKVNITSIVRRISEMYSKKIYKNYQVNILSENDHLELCTYSNQLKIFLLQIFDILGQSKNQHEEIFIEISLVSNRVSIQFKNVDHINFYRKVYENFLIKLILNLIIEETDSIRYKLQFILKNYTLDSFQQMKTLNQ